MVNCLQEIRFQIREKYGIYWADNSVRKSPKLNFIRILSPVIEIELLDEHITFPLHVHFKQLMGTAHKKFNFCI
jgi:hypothetical protein